MGLEVGPYTDKAGEKVAWGQAAEAVRHPLSASPAMRYRVGRYILQNGIKYDVSNFTPRFYPTMSGLGLARTSMPR